MKRYNIIYADPPWRYADKRASAVTDRPQAYGGITYPTMEIEEMCNLPVKDISETNAVLFMWATMPLLEQSFQVIKAWGFKYKTCAFVWVKTNGRNPRLFLMNVDIRSGLGSYTNANAELCLLATRGKYIERERRDVKQVIFAPVERHSQKPAEARERIIAMYGEVPRVELFARKRVDGWDAWGNEVESDLVMV